MRPTSVAEAPAPTTLVARPAASALPAPLAQGSTSIGSPAPAPSSAVLTPAPALAASASPYATVAPSATAGADATQAIERAIADYKRAYESQDIALFRTVKPDLSQSDEKVLRDTFKAVKSWSVGITIESIQVEPAGNRATVKASRQDVINGRLTPRQSQTFHLVRAAGAWQIQSMGH